MKEYCGNPGRGSHALSLVAAEKIYECREELSKLISLSDPLGIVFTLNTTHALNLVIKGLLRQGDHVIISDMEHNSVLRPLAKMEKNGVIEYSVFDSLAEQKDKDLYEICASVERLIKPNTKAVICSHASNICSAVLPVEEIGALCKRYGIFFIVDAAQSAGHMTIDMEKMNIDALCAPAHKGLYGPQGCGFAALTTKIASELDTIYEGGNGYMSFEKDMPETSPERYEVGTLATPAVAGLLEGVRFVEKIGLEEIHERECELFRYARERLLSIKGVEIYLPWHEGSVLLFNKDGVESERLARMLSSANICVRAGYHCSPLAHVSLGTPPGGAVRISFSVFNKRSDLDAFVRAVSKA